MEARATSPLPLPVSPWRSTDGQAAAGLPAGDQAPDLIPDGLDRRALSHQLGQGIHRAPTLPLLLNSLLSFLPL